MRKSAGIFVVILGICFTTLGWAANCEGNFSSGSSCPSCNQDSQGNGGAGKSKYVGHGTSGTQCVFAVSYGSCGGSSGNFPQLSDHYSCTAPAKCVGKSTDGKGCGAVNATSSTCGNYYMSDSPSSTQCKWNGSSCSNGGGACSP